MLREMRAEPSRRSTSSSMALTFLFVLWLDDARYRKKIVVKETFIVEGLVRDERRVLGCAEMMVL